MTCAGTDEHPIAKVRVEFVQFSDGSGWGDANSNSAKLVLEVRNETLAELNTLEHIYEQAGADAFLEEFAQSHDYLPTISLLKHTCQDKAKNSTCAYDAVQRAIDAAKEHQTEIDLGMARQASAPR